MPLSVCCIASGSRGNCHLVRSGKSAALVDIGIPVGYLLKNLEILGVRPSEITAVLVTHAHGDHTSGVAAFSDRFGAPVYISEDAAEGVAARIGADAYRRAAVFSTAAGAFAAGDMSVTPFALSHDAPCTGFKITSDGETLSVLTDLGEASDRVLAAADGADTLIIEANHDPALLRANPKYPSVLKRRIMSREGHLSNAAAADAVIKLCGGGRLRRVILAHLSMENNYPSLALNTVCAALRRAGIDAGAPEISVAEQYAPTGLIPVRTRTAAANRSEIVTMGFKAV